MAAPVGEQVQSSPSAAAAVLLQPTLRLALDVARSRMAAEPQGEVPKSVRPFLTFGGRALPEPAVAALWRWVDGDPELRDRLAELGDSDELGRAGWLFVARPGGWEPELATLIDDAEARSRADQEERDERSARRKLSHAEEAKRRAEEAAAGARADLAAATSQLAAERRERRAVREEAEHLGRRVASLEGERDSARRKAAEAGAEVERLQAELAMVHAELSRAQAAVEAFQAEAEAAALATRAAQLRVEAGGAPAPAPAPAMSPGAVGAEVARAVADAAAAAADLARALGEASAALSPAPPAAVPARPSPTRAAPPPRRRPSALPPAVFEDTTAAAAHLVRLPGVLVLVDGYNAAKALWPDQPALELRERLNDALSELVARTGAQVHVVFDGTAEGPHQAGAVSRRGVRVSFSPEQVEADDVVLALVDQTALDTPVVVASNDRRVQDGARSRGANVISIAQLAAAIGRDAPG